MSSPTDGLGARIAWPFISVLLGLLAGMTTNYVSISSAHSADIAVLKSRTDTNESALRQINQKLDRLLEHTVK